LYSELSRLDRIAAGMETGRDAGYSEEVGTHRQSTGEKGRQPLDSLIRRLDEPDFRAHHSRETGLRETSAHVNPLMFVGATKQSPYVNAWRHHAERCPACRRVFEYFGL